MLEEFYGKVTDHLSRTVNYPRWTPGVYPGRESIGRAIREGVQYMCLDRDAVAGAFILNCDPQGDYSEGDWKLSLRDGEYMVLHTLAVLPELSGRGIGKYIVGWCIEQAKAEGFRALRVDAVPDNIPARRLYESMGFVFAGERDLRRGIEGIPKFALYEFQGF